MTDFLQRFAGIARLYGSSGLDCLRQSRACIVGLGGVGSWTAEALARSGIGHLALVDLDEVCISNVNRQVPALDGEIGKPKVEVMARRLAAINPECRVDPIADFFTAETADAILSARFGVVVDAIDRVTNKCLLIARCHQRRIPVVTTGGAGGRRDPAKLRVDDLAATSHDPLLQEVRRGLRRDHGFPRDPKQPFGIPCVYSTEPPVTLETGSPPCDVPHGTGAARKDCNDGYGSAAFVTGAFGFFAAGEAVRTIVETARHG